MKKYRNITLIFGMTGSGKTELGKKIIQENQVEKKEGFNRLIIIDTQEEHKQGIIFENYSDLVNYLLYGKMKEKIDLELSSFNFIIRFHRSNTYLTDMDKLFSLIYELGNITLVLEEANLYINTFDKKLTPFLKLVTQGRHKSINIIGIVRYPSELSPLIRGSVNTIYSFQQTNPNYVKQLEKFGLPDTDKLTGHQFIKREF